MTSYTSQLKTWGDSGVEYPDNHSQNDNVPPVDAYHNFLFSNVIDDVLHLVDVTNTRLDSSVGNTRPSSPVDGQLFWNISNTPAVLEVYDETYGNWKKVSASDQLNNHINDETNPHNVTAAQAGASPSSHNHDGRYVRTILDGDTTVNNVETVIFSSNLEVIDQGNGVVTIVADSGVDSHTAISEDGTQTVGSVDDINFVGHLNVIDDGDGTVTIDPTHNHDSRYVKFDTDIFYKQEGGTVADGYFVPMGQFRVPNGDSLYVEQAVLSEDGFNQPAANGVRLVIASETATSFNDTVTILSGDGSTMYSGEDSSNNGSFPISFSNGTGSDLSVTIGVDNGHFYSGTGQDVPVFAGYKARIV